MARTTDEMRRYVQWDVRNWSRALDFWSTTCGPSPFVGAEVLEIGSRDGGLSLWFATQGASRVVCSDRTGPTDVARELHTEAGVSDRVEYASIDATDIGVLDTFDVVAFKSVLGGRRRRGRLRGAGRSGREHVCGIAPRRRASVRREPGGFADAFLPASTFRVVG